MDDIYMKEALRLAEDGMNTNQGGPFGCVVVRDGVIIGRGQNRVTSTFDPTAHAEVTAIRDACRHLHSFQLDGCDIYTSCEPCPMCLGAIYWARPRAVYFACTRKDAADIQFDDQYIYDEIGKDLSDRTIPMIQMMSEEGRRIFRVWEKKEDKTPY